MKDDYGNDKLYRLSDILENISTQIQEFDSGKKIKNDSLTFEIVYSDENNEEKKEIIKLDVKTEF